MTVIYFIIYGFLGWLIDTSYRSWLEGYFSPGTWIPYMSIIYPFAALVMIYAYKHWLHRRPYWAQYLALTGIATAIEYAGGWIGVWVLNRQLWDYHYMPFDLHGFINPLHSLTWGILAMFLVHVLHPHLESLLYAQKSRIGLGTR